MALCLWERLSFICCRFIFIFILLPLVGISSDALKLVKESLFLLILCLINFFFWNFLWIFQIILIFLSNYHSFGKFLEWIIICNVKRILRLTINLVHKASLFLWIILCHHNIDWKQFVYQERLFYLFLFIEKQISFLLVIEVYIAKKINDSDRSGYN